MDDCCTGKTEQLETLWTRQAKILWIVLAINSAMFLAELSAGLIAGSVALLADSLDMLGDALVYGASLYVVGRSLRARAGAAMLKGSVMLVTGLGVIAETIHRVLHPEIPHVLLMSGMAGVALLANGVCLFLLTRHRGDDINMRSSWICSRNDIAANLGVLAAAAGVYFTQSIWPDIVVGALVTCLFLWSSLRVLAQAAREFRRASSNTPPMAAPARGSRV